MKSQFASHFYFNSDITKAPLGYLLFAVEYTCCCIIRMRTFYSECLYNGNYHFNNSLTSLTVFAEINCALTERKGGESLRNGVSGCTQHVTNHGQVMPHQQRRSQVYQM